MDKPKKTPLPAPILAIVEASSFPPLQVVSNQVGGSSLDKLANAAFKRETTR